MLIITELVRFPIPASEAGKLVTLDLKIIHAYSLIDRRSIQTTCSTSYNFQFY